MQYRLQLVEDTLNLNIVANSEEEAKNIGYDLIIEILQSSMGGCDSFNPLTVDLISIKKEYTPLRTQEERSSSQNSQQSSAEYTSIASLQGTARLSGYNRLT